MFWPRYIAAVRAQPNQHRGDHRDAQSRPPASDARSSFRPTVGGRESHLMTAPLDRSGQPAPLLDDAGIAELLRSARRIAVVGASSNPARPSHGVFRTLIAAGYECVPVNPNETTVEGIPAVATLAEAAAALGGHIDIVDVFRRPEVTEEIAREAVAVGAGALWLQLGVVNEETARIAADGGLAVVMDRCTAIEIRRVGRD